MYTYTYIRIHLVPLGAIWYCSKWSESLRATSPNWLIWWWCRWGGCGLLATTSGRLFSFFFSYTELC